MSEAKALSFEDQNVAPVNQAIQERGRQALLAEDLGPLRKRQIRGEAYAGAFVAVGTVVFILRGSLLVTSNGLRQQTVALV